MQQFDVVRLKKDSTNTLFLILQSEFLMDLHSIVIAPLRPVGAGEIISPRLNPVLTVLGTDYRLETHSMAAVLRAEIGPPVSSCTHQRYDILNAIDAVFIGF